MNLIDLYEKYGLLALIIIIISSPIIVNIVYYFGKIPVNFIFIDYILVFISIGYICINRFFICKKSPQERTLPHFKISTKSPILIRFIDIFLIFIFISLIIILQVNEKRPSLYYLLLMSGIILFIIQLFIEKDTGGHIIYIIKGMVLSIISTISIFKIYFWTGIDTWTHALINNGVVISQDLYLALSDGKEISYPLQHLLVPITDIISTLDIRISSLFAVGFSGITVSVIIYLLVRCRFGWKLGILAMIMMNLNINILIYRIMSVTTTLALTFFIICLYLLYLYKQNLKVSKQVIFILIICCLCLNLSHLFSTFVVIFVMISIYIADVIKENNIKSQFLLVTFIPILVTIGYWLFAGWGFDKLATIIMGVFRPSSVASTLTVVTTLEPTGFMGICDMLLRGLPLTMLTSSIILLLLLFVAAKKDSDCRYIWYLIIPYITCVLMYVVVGIFYTAMAERFGVFLAVFNSIGIAYLIFQASKTSTVQKYSKICVVFIIVILAVYCFVNVAHPSINQDNKFWLKTSTTGLESITYGESSGFTTLSQLISLDYANKIWIDYGGTPALTFYQSGQRYSEKGRLFLPMYEIKYLWWDYQTSPKNGDYIIFRENLIDSYSSKRTYTGSAEHGYSSEFVQITRSDGEIFNSVANRVYDNHHIYLYGV